MREHPIQYVGTLELDVCWRLPKLLVPRQGKGMSSQLFDFRVDYYDCWDPLKTIEIFVDIETIIRSGRVRGLSFP